MIRVFSRYLGVQVFAYLIDVGIFLALSRWLGPLPANVISKTVAGVVGFISHRRITFKVHNHGGGRSQLLKYAALLALNIPLSSGFLSLFMKWLAPPVLAKFVADVACTGLNFLLSHYVVFRHPRATRPQ